MFFNYNTLLYYFITKYDSTNIFKSNSYQVLGYLLIKYLLK